MGRAKSTLPPPSKFRRQATTFTLSNAKTYLGRLADKATRGEPVYIVRGRERFLLQRVPDLLPIPLRPPGYFADCYEPAEIVLRKSTPSCAPRTD